jgi:uncharacterized protein (DUF58 family)
MAENVSPSIDPEILSKTSSLKIRARTLVEGFLSGQHKSPHKGASVEFAEYKPYSPGDDIRHIDWKAVGKTDKYHVKQFEQSTNLKCTIMLDSSGSMAYESPNKKNPAANKMEYSRTLAGALSYLILNQFDAVGLTTFNDKTISHIPPRSKPSHFQHIIHDLENIIPSGITRFDKVIDSLSERTSGRGMAIIISDFFAREDNLIKSLKLLSSRGLETILFHIIHPDELFLPFEGDVVFESLEDDPSVGLDPYDIRDAYHSLMMERIDSFKNNFQSLGIDYVFLDTSQPLDQGLNYYLLKRKSLQKWRS